MSKKWGKLFAGLLIVAMAGCAECPTANYELTADDNGRQLQLLTGDTLSVELKSNPTTGYRWQFVAPDDPGVLNSTGDEFIAPQTERCGAPGRQKLSFTAAASGETVLRLDYVRPWEKDTPPMQSFRVPVVVKRR